MKNTLKKAISVLLVAVMLFGAAPLTGFVGLELPDWLDSGKLFAVEAEAETLNGTCGANLTWILDTSTGELVISGTGAMKYWSSSSSVPWFSYRSYIKTVTIGNSVTSIGNFAFYECYNLTSITIPDSVTSIGYRAFDFCRSLTSITIPDSVISIDYGAFCGCSSLTSITIPDSVTSIGDCAFLDCESLTSITVDANNKNYSCNTDGVLFNKDKTALIQYPIGNTKKSYTIPDSVTSIGYYAFAYCTSLTSITIPDSVTSIGDYAFYYCRSLTSITIPDSVTSIGNYAFEYCTSLTSITIPDSVTSIGDSAFSSCESLTSITIPDSVTSIGDEAFYHCANLASITIPDSVTSIGRSAFAGCDSLTSITIPDSVTSVGNFAFSSCARLADVYFAGTIAQWNEMLIGSDNESLTNATIHFNYIPGTPEQQYTVTWDANGGIWSDGNTRKTLECAEGSEIAAPFNPVKDSYKFVGWVPAIPEKMPAKDLTFTALWEEVGSSEEPDIPPETYEYETVVGVLKEYETSVILNGTARWISKVCIDGYWYNLYEDYAYQERIRGYKDKRVVAVVYNGYVSTIRLLSELKTDPKIYNFDSSIPTLEYYDGVFRKYDGSRADKWHTVSGTIANPFADSLIDASKIPALESLKLKNVTVTIKSSDKDIISLDNGFWDIESDSMTIEIGDIGAGESINISERVLNLKTKWKFPKDKKEHSVTLYYTVTGTLNGQTITKEYSETITLINKDYGINTPAPEKMQSIRALFDEILEEVNNCDDLTESEKLEVKMIIISNETALDFGKAKEQLDAAKKVYDIGKYILGVENVTYGVAGEYVVDAILEHIETQEDELEDAIKNVLRGFAESESFNKYVQWYIDEHGISVNSSKRIDARCPVDVYVFDEKGRTVLSIVENVITQSDEDIHAFVCEDDKIIYLPTDADYDIKIIATGNGTMDYIVTEYCSENELRKTVYEDIPLVVDEYYTGAVTKSTMPESAVYNLISSDGTKIGYNSVEYVNRNVDVQIEIREPSTTTIKYGDSIVLHADMSEALPNGWKVEWTASNGNFSYTVSDDGATCTITPSKSGSTVFTATVYDANGNEVSKDEQTMTSKAGFFDKIIAFFKKIFGLVKVIPEAYNGTY